MNSWIIHKINGLPFLAECPHCSKNYHYEELRHLGGMKKYIAIEYCPNCGRHIEVIEVE